MGVSIITAARNAAATIRETLDSVLAQDYEKWELIVIDDGSTDSTAAMVLKAAASDKRIRLLREPAGGVSRARNLGIADSRFDLVLFLDADDLLSPGHLARLTARLDQDGSIGAAYSDTEFLTKGGMSRAESTFRQSGDLFHTFTRTCAFAIHSCIVRRDLVQRAGRFDESLSIGEDWDLWQRIARMGIRFEHVAGPPVRVRVRTASASSRVQDLFVCGRRLIEQGHRLDDRVCDAHPDHTAGSPAEELDEANLLFALYCAGEEAETRGANLSRGELMALCAPHGARHASPVHMGSALYFGARRAALRIDALTRNSYWVPVYEWCADFLMELEGVAQSKGLAKRVQRCLERLIVEGIHAEAPITIGSTHARTVEITEPIPHVTVTPSVERVIFRIHIEGEDAGSLELPAFDGAVPDFVLRDAIVSHFAWQILERFIKDDQNRWAIFMREIWGVPDAALNDFYLPSDEAAPGPWEFAGNMLAPEISDELPDVRADGVICVLPKIGGAAAGVVRVEAASTRVTAAQLRVAITTQTGFELCRIVVREALVGHSLRGPGLRERLAASAARALPTPVTGMKPHWCGTAVGARASGPIGTSASRWAALPSACKALTLDAAAEEGLPVVRAGANSGGQLIYHPGLFDLREAIEVAEERALSDGSPRNIYDRTHWEGLFAGGADPWDYGNSYERLKYEQTASLIPARRFERALELGCAEGHFTAQLAGRVDHLTAADISEIALGRARQRCAGIANIAWRRLNIVTDDLGGPWDLIVCSEMLYYMRDQAELGRVARKLATALRPGGWLVGAHAHLLTDDPEGSGFDWGLPFGGKVIGETLAAAEPLRLRRMIRTPLYRVLAFESGAKGDAVVEVIKANHAEPLPRRLGEMVRKPARPAVAASSWTPETSRLPILMYHRVAPNGSPALARWRLHPEQFREQMAYLAETGYRAIGLDEWRVACGAHRPLPGRAVVITFDDGYRDFAEYAWPVLRQFGFRPYLFVPAQLVGKTNEWDAEEEELPLMDWPEILRLRAEGVRIGSHAASHRSLLSLSYTDVYAELVASRLEIRRKLEAEVDTIAYPFGEMDGVIAHIAGAAGYRYGLTTEAVAAPQHKSLLELPRLEVRPDAGFEAFVNSLKQS